MDPNLYTEQAGLSPEKRPSGDGADYLYRLKAQLQGEAASVLANEASAGGAAPVEVSPIPAPVPYSGKERRRSARFRCNGSVEFKPEGSDVRMWGTLTDVSLHGCYVEMSTTFPVGTNVNLVMDALGIRVQAAGTVRVSYPFLGMGICLTSLEPGQQTQLEQLLAAVAGQNAAPDSAVATEADTKNADMSIEPTACLDEIRQFFANHQLLSREEFLRIEERCQKP